MGLICLSVAASLLNNMGQARGGVSVIWLSNGLMIGVLLCTPRKQWPVFLIVGAVIDFAVNVALQTPPSYSAYLTFCNVSEILVASFAMYRVVAPNPDLTEPRQFRNFLLYGALLAPFTASFLAVYPLKTWLGVTFWHGMQYWFAADVMGITTITPLYLSYHHGHTFSPRSNAETTTLILVLIAVSLIVFGFLSYPVLWLVMLSMIVLGVRVGFTGSAVGLLIVAFIGGYFTVNRRGPLSSVSHTALSLQILLFQIFIITNMLALYFTEVATVASARMRLGLEASETRFRLLAEASRDIIVLAGLQGDRKYSSPAATEVLGWSQEEMLGDECMAHPEDAPRWFELLDDCRGGKETVSLSFRCVKKDGQYIWLESNISLVRDPATKEPTGFVYILRDISERKIAEDKLQDAFNIAEQLAMVDGLTGVANRRLLDETLNREWMRAVRDGTSISLLLIDVDHFKLYNDIYGHLAGDLCLQTIATAIQNGLRRPPDLLARYGGEEFVVVLPNTPSPGAEVMSTSVLKAVEKCAIPHAGNPHGTVTVSLGCATMIATLDSNPTDLLKLADGAMYRAKANGRNQIQLAGSELFVN